MPSGASERKIARYWHFNWRQHTEKLAKNKFALKGKLLNQSASSFSKTVIEMLQSSARKITWSRCCSPWALSIFVALIVSCNSPEVVPIQDSGAEESTLQSDSVIQLRIKTQDPDPTEPIQVDGALGGLEGFVRDGGGNPIGMVNIQIDGLEMGGVTGPNGYYLVSRIPPDVHTLVVRAPGLNQNLSVRILPDSILQFDITLE